MTDPLSNRSQRVLTPTQLNALARSLLEDSFPLVEVQGEISNLARPASGHIYLSLKDRNAQVRCALFRPKSQWLRFKPADGQLVVGRGRVTLYEPRGDYQLVLEHMEPAGEGLLQRAFEELKAKLLAEGLFEAARKRPMPARIRRIALLTSPSGAAVHDVLTVLRRRYPLIEVDLLPIPVQGSECPPRAIDMLRRADQSQRYDVLMLTRGGGSLEDLAGFNDESLARAIVASTTPVVCAIGHEVDVCIAELVADLRAPTPTAAAEALTPDGQALRRQLHKDRERLQQCVQRRLQQQAQRLDQLHARLQVQQPLLRLQRAEQRAEELRARLLQAMRHSLQRRREHARHQLQRLQVARPQRQIERDRQQLRRLRLQLQGRMAASLQTSARGLAQLGRTLHAISPLATLDRGYAILRHEDRLVRSIHDAQPGNPLRAQLRDGSLNLHLVSIQDPTQ